MREYETLYLLSPDIPSDKAEEINKKLTDLIQNQGGHVLTSFNWGKRRLAYRVAKNFYGIYVYVNYLGENNLVSEVERILKYDDNILRFVTMKLHENVNVEQRKAEKRDLVLTSIDEVTEKSVPEVAREMAELSQV